MRQNNAGMKIVLVILVIVCLFQGCSLASLGEDLDVLRGDVDTLTSSLRDLRFELSTLQSEDEAAMDVTWGIEEIDWQNRTYTVSFAAKVPYATDSTKVVINNGIESLELDKESNTFSGKMEYPIDNKDYDTNAYLYDGSYEQDSLFVDTMGIEYLLGKFFMCEFYGYSAYGNDKLTVAGTLAYLINLEDNVTAMKLVCDDEEYVLDHKLSGEKEINASIPVVVTDAQENVQIKAMYLEVTTESGIIFNVYPYLSVNNNYVIGTGEMMEVIYPDQQAWVDVILPDGTTYELNIY